MADYSKAVAAAKQKPDKPCNKTIQKCPFSEESVEGSVSERVNEKRFEPTSAEEVVNRLEQRRQEIKEGGYHGPKYTEDELDFLVDEGCEARFIARFVFYDRESAPGNTLGWKRDSGRAPYWTATLDSIENADSDPLLLADTLGIDNVDPNKGEFGLLIIDTHDLPGNTARESFVPTDERMAGFCKRELLTPERDKADKLIPQKFNEADIDYVFTEEYAGVYNKHSTAVIEGSPNIRFAETDPRATRKYLKKASLSRKEERLFNARNEVEAELGATRHFSGNGKSKLLKPRNGQKSGAVESFTFERDPKTIEELGAAVTYIPLKVI